ncbi:hypothetical protein [Flavobacterium fluviale]|uniref:Uncharacterized protein n=1 Tax=Flavobacterium fluviale TaxID=2249356 RepID=A0A344LSH7_9FLAO|nr:hypothetical protein [Flavobacterium fluviale]AXB56869.1 hypothetical protein HYN86_09805 [Flavobacterium fluviale]
METKKKYLLCLFIVLNCFSQHKTVNYFFEEVPISKLPIVLDGISFENLDAYQEVFYENIKNFLISKNEDFVIKMGNPNSKFYVIGKYEFYDKIAVVMLTKSEQNGNNLTNCFLLMYDKDGGLSSYRTVAWIGNEAESKTALINSNNILEFENSLDKDNTRYLTYYSLNMEKNYFPFSDDKCNEIEACVNYRPSIDSIPERKIKKYIFDKSFFRTEKKLIPLKYCSTDSISQILSSIGNENKLSMKNYFLDSKKIEDGKKIVFFLNKFKYKNYKNVSEVGYQVFNKNGSLNKREQIAQYYTTKDETESIISSNVFIEKGNIRIETQEKGSEKKVHLYKLDGYSEM